MHIFPVDLVHQWGKGSSSRHLPQRASRRRRGIYTVELGSLPRCNGTVYYATLVRRSCKPAVESLERLARGNHPGATQQDKYVVWQLCRLHSAFESKHHTIALQSVRCSVRNTTISYYVCSRASGFQRLPPTPWLAYPEHPDRTTLRRCNGNDGGSGTPPASHARIPQPRIGGSAWPRNQRPTALGQSVCHFLPPTRLWAAVSSLYPGLRGANGPWAGHSARSHVQNREEELIAVAYSC